MKRLLIALIVLTALGFIGSQALACMWDGYWDGNYSNVNASGNYQKFQNDTAQLRGVLANKQGEYNALMAQPNPDPKRTGTLSQEIAELHDQLRAKAQAYNLPASGYRNSHRSGYYNDYCNYGGRGCW